MSNWDVAKSEFKDWLKRKLKPKKAVSYDEPPIAQKTFFPVKSKEKVKSEKDRYGGVVIHNNKVLLVNPSNNFGGYAWTFPKGGAKIGESPEDAAVREVEEESGYVCKVVGKVPGTFAGTTSDNHYFLMRPVKQGDFGWETAQVDWASFRHAQKMIMQTGIIGNMTGMRRDLKILYAAFGKELFPEQLKAIEDRAIQVRKEEDEEEQRQRDEELKAKLGEKGFRKYKAYQAEIRRRMAERKAQMSDQMQQSVQRKAQLRNQRKEELLRFKLGDEGYEQYKKFLADREEELKRRYTRPAGVSKYPAAYSWGSSSKVDPRCFRCNGTRFETKGKLTTCQDCGAMWLSEKPEIKPVKKPERWVQKKFDWPKEGK